MNHNLNSLLYFSEKRDRDSDSDRDREIDRQIDRQRERERERERERKRERKRVREKNEEKERGEESEKQKKKIDLIKPSKSFSVQIAAPLFAQTLSPCFCFKHSFSSFWSLFSFE